MSAEAATLNLSFANEELYQGCDVETVAGRPWLKTLPSTAIHLVGRNAEIMINTLVERGVNELTLTGAAAIWVYLVVFHSAVHRFRQLYYDDGKAGGKLLIAAH